MFVLGIVDVIVLICLRGDVRECGVVWYLNVGMEKCGSVEKVTVEECGTVDGLIGKLLEV